MRKWPALDVRHAANVDLILAAADDFGPSAADQQSDELRLFFSSTSLRDQACAALRARGYHANPVEVDDEDWARRSQASLGPTTVGRITVVPPWAGLEPSATTDFGKADSSVSRSAAPSPGLKAPGPEPPVIIIAPSMGFGTGHHSTTRLCLAALQNVDLGGRRVLDVGTGSGLLAIAAAHLGAAHVVAIDHDPDAVQAAQANLGLNPSVSGVELWVQDLASGSLPASDVVVANLTGALLFQSAGRLLNAVSPGGSLIVSGLLVEERDEAVRAFGVASLVWEHEEDGWIGLVFRRP